MRVWLDRCYLFGASLAGLCFVSILVLILAQIIGRWFGLIIPSVEDFSSFLLVAASFMGLAYTFRHHGHIRVNILLEHVNTKTQFGLEIFCHLLGAILAAFMSWSFWALVWDSYQYNEMSSGYIAVPQWIVQVPMLVGMVLLTMAIVDQLIVRLQRQGGEP